jgi:hypothetical protein
MAYVERRESSKGTRYRGHYKAADGRYRSAGTYGTEERALEAARAAEKHAAELVGRAVGQLDPVVRATRTIREYEPIFMRHHRVEGNTKDTYADILRLHVVPRLAINTHLHLSHVLRQALEPECHAGVSIHPPSTRYRLR